MEITNEKNIETAKQKFALTFSLIFPESMTNTISSIVILKKKKNTSHSKIEHFLFYHMIGKLKESKTKMQTM